MSVVSTYSKPGHIAHEYSDHVSQLKFVERNWGLKRVSGPSRDNFPTSIARRDNP